MREACVQVIPGMDTGPASAVWLFRMEITSVVCAVPMMKLVRPDAFSLPAKHIVLYGCQGDVAEAGEFSVVVTGAGKYARHGGLPNGLRQIHEPAAFGNAGQAARQCIAHGYQHGLIA